MIGLRTFDRPVGAWRFHTEPLLEAASSQLVEEVRSVIVATQVLESLGLFRPALLVVPAWIRLDALVRSPDPATRLRLGTRPEVDRVLEELVTLQPEAGLQLMPSDIVVRDDPLDPANATPGWFDVSTLWDGVGATVTVNTYTDGWMPFSVSGAAQTGLSNQLAPRLTEALGTLASRLGVEVDPAEPTRYATPGSDGLLNARDSDGELWSGATP